MSIKKQSIEKARDLAGIPEVSATFTPGGSSARLKVAIIPIIYK